MRPTRNACWLYWGHELAIKENFFQYTLEVLERLSDHVRNADAPRSKFQHSVYDARTDNLVNHLLETLDLGLEDQNQEEKS
jgi:hypothetical protein